MKNYNMILTEKQQKYQQYHMKILINIGTFQVNKYCFLTKNKKYNKYNNKIDELKQIDC